MCIAILKPKGVEISKKTLMNCREKNKDGIGFAYTDGEYIYINKYMDFDTFYKDFEKVKDISTMLIHFRIATHGKVEVKNCHPFKLNDRMALIHNGVISGYGDKDNKTDTQDFIEKVIGNISYKMWKNPSYRELVGKAIGYSKLCILDKSGKYYIINEDRGQWVDGIWYSNDSYKDKEEPVYAKYNKTTSEQKGLWDMYGQESYDDWYKRYYGKESPCATKTKNKSLDDDCYAIYRCKKCGKEFYDQWDNKKVKCTCGSKDVKDVGYVYDGTECYYQPA